MIVADTGFLVSLYLSEVTTAEAETTARATSYAIIVTDFCWLEFRNALNRAVFTGRIDADGRDALWGQAEEDAQRGIFETVLLDTTIVFAKARELSDRHTPSIGARTLDLLHVASALLLEATEFWSFDQRQRSVAAAEGLAVKP